jgi:hypothetical protein
MVNTIVVGTATNRLPIILSIGLLTDMFVALCAEEATAVFPDKPKKSRGGVRWKGPAAPLPLAVSMSA